MTTETKAKELTAKEIQELMNAQGVTMEDLQNGKIKMVKENNQTIDGFIVSVSDVKAKIKDGKAVEGVSGGLVNIKGNGANGLTLSNRPSLNIETVLHIIKNRKQYLRFLCDTDQQYRQSGQKQDAHQIGDDLVTMAILKQEGFLTSEMEKLAQ